MGFLVLTFEFCMARLAADATVINWGLPGASGRGMRARVFTVPGADTSLGSI